MKSLLFGLLATLAFALPISTAKAEGNGEFTLKSPDFSEGDTLANKHIYKGFGCSGENTPPRLVWDGAPKDTAFFALTLYDPDAPTGSGWWHWLALNLPKETTSLDGHNLPAGALETRTDFGTTGYGGPCPPVGDKPHRYIFTLYALKGKIDAGPDTPAAQIGFQINSLKIGEATLTGYYGR